MPQSVMRVAGVLVAVLFVTGLGACRQAGSQARDTGASAVADTDTEAGTVPQNKDGPRGGQQHAASATSSTRRMLRVCADPNNLPFSNDREEGFENKLASLVGADMGAEVRYTWWAQRRGFVRNTLNARACDVIMGVPARFELTATTSPYYRSTYVFVQRAEDHRHVRSFDDDVLRQLRIGVQLIGDDGANAPPAHALASRHIIRNVVGYSVYGDYRTPNPPARIVEAVARGEIDVAVAWGPLAGYFAGKEAVPLRLTPVSPPADSPVLPFVFDISMGVRRQDDALRAQLEEIIARRRVEIDRILDAYHVPRVNP